MRTLLFLAFFGVRALASDSAAPVFVALEKELNGEREAFKKGERETAAFSAFVSEFRPRLDKAAEDEPATGANAAAHARILVLLGDHGARKRSRSTHRFARAR